MSTVRRQLSQQEIDSVFQSMQGSSRESAEAAQPYNFLRPDHIPATQLRAIHILHENFARSLASSLSAYLRSYVTVDLISFEQISYSEFLEQLPSPTVMASLDMRPYDGTGVLELNPALVFPVLEMLLGGTGSSKPMQREITEIETHLMEGLLRVIIQGLRDAWRSVATIDFSIQSIEKEPQFLRIPAANEAVVAIGLDIRAGSGAGAMNIAIPSLVIKMLRQRFDQQWTAKRSAPPLEQQQRMLRLINPSETELEIVLRGPKIPLRDLVNIRKGDVLILDYPTDKPVSCLINDQPRFEGTMVRLNRGTVLRPGFRIESWIEGQAAAGSPGSL